MAEVNFPANSDKALNNKNISTEPVEFSPLIVGNSTIKKKNLGRKIFDLFVADDVQDIKTWVIKQWVVPTLQAGISRGAQILCGNMNSFLLPSTTLNAGKFNYAGVQPAATQSNIWASKDVTQYNQIALDTEYDVQILLNAFAEAFSNNRVVTIQEYYNWCKQRPSDHRATEWCWTNINGYSVQHGSDGKWYLILPRPTVVPKR